MSDELFDAANAAMARAHAPYSNFPVGAAIRCDDGRVFAGANIENASYPEGWCAETTAIAHMVMAGASRIAEVAVVAERKDFITPCGGCRQRLAEFAAGGTLVHLYDRSGKRETVTMRELLPRAFQGDDLK